MLLRDKKIIYIHIPKCAGVSVEKLFGWIGARHETMQVYADDYSKEFLESCFKFTFVRNHWARMVSWYFYHKDWWYEDKTKEGFQSWVKDGMKSHWVDNGDGTNWNNYDSLSCIDFLRNNKNIDFDYIGKVETINEDMKYICEKTNVEYKELPHINKSTHKHYREYYNEETKNIVEERLERDFLFFPYEF
tara:strand:+ start:525 stop:1094 length:570 start_codon:yes stop_codon:yes gene_type:complete